MQLLNISFAGYRNFAARNFKNLDLPLANIEVAPITILLGKNNSGKSTVLRLIEQTLSALSADGEDPFPMSDDVRKYGKKFREIQHAGIFFNPLDINVRFSTGNQFASLNVQLMSLGELADEALPVIQKWEFNGINIEPSTALISGLLPPIPEANPWRQQARNLLDNSCSLGPIRDAVESTYDVAPSKNLKPNTNSMVAQLLQEDTELRSAVSQWFTEHLEGVRLDVNRVLDTFSLVTQRSHGQGQNLAEAGQGLQQVLAFVTLCLWRKIGRGRTPFLDLVEQPEIHLHDAAHASLGDLLVEATSGKLGRMIVETHSEALILRLRRRISEGSLSPNQVALYFVEETGSGSGLRRIPISADGDVVWWPEGVFSETFEEVKAIRRAQRERMES